jgi:hypothetical protein
MGTVALLRVAGTGRACSLGLRHAERRRRLAVKRDGRRPSGCVPRGRVPAYRALPEERTAVPSNAAAVLGEDERAFFSAVAGLLPALFFAAILQREGTKVRDGTTPASEPSDADWPAIGFYVAIFLMLAGELAAIHALRTGHVRDVDYGYVTVATVLLVWVIIGRIIRTHTQRERTVHIVVMMMLGALSLLWFVAM